jgi:hypothetical protein
MPNEETSTEIQITRTKCIPNLLFCGKSALENSYLSKKTQQRLRRLISLSENVSLNALKKDFF